MRKKAQADTSAATDHLARARRLISTDSAEAGVAAKATTKVEDAFGDDGKTADAETVSAAPWVPLSAFDAASWRSRLQAAELSERSALGDALLAASVATIATRRSLLLVP